MRVLTQRIGHVVKHGHVGEQRPRLEQHAHTLAHGVEAGTRHGRYVFAVKQDLAAIRRDLPADQAQQRGFTDP